MRATSVMAGLAAEILLLGAVVSALAMLGRHWWGFELLTHFQWQYFVAAVTCVGLILLWGRVRWLLLGLPVLLWQGYQLTDWFVPRSAATSEGAALRVLQFNVQFDNAYRAETVDWILALPEESVDVLALTEISPEWLNDVRRLESRFPHTMYAPADSPFGLAVLSRVPLDATDRLIFDGGGPPSLRVQGRTDNGMAFALYLTHPPPPIGGTLSGQRNEQLVALGDRIGAEDTEYRLAVGDFNVTPWSPWFDEFVRLSGLTEAQTGLGYVSTWPARGLGSWFGGLYIDLAFASDNIAVIDRRIWASVYSDHRPVLTTFWLNASDDFFE